MIFLPETKEMNEKGFRFWIRGLFLPGCQGADQWEPNQWHCEGVVVVVVTVDSVVVLVVVFRKSAVVREVDVDGIVVAKKVDVVHGRRASRPSVAQHHRRRRSPRSLRPCLRRPCHQH